VMKIKRTTKIIIILIIQMIQFHHQINPKKLEKPLKLIKKKNKTKNINKINKSMCRHLQNKNKRTNNPHNFYQRNLPQKAVKLKIFLHPMAK
jgi:hypothetical protein